MISKQWSSATESMVFLSPSNLFPKIYTKYIPGMVKGFENFMKVFGNDVIN